MQDKISSSLQIQLKKGDVGDNVSQLQQMLNKCGTKLKIDGCFGTATLTAVVSFQQSKGLKITGIVDGETWDLLQAQL